MNNKKTVGILGGMGPLATADLFRKIIELTEAHCDQDHIKMVIANNTSIPDRTEFLVNDGQSPYQEMLASAKLLEKSSVDCIIMPCNTAHYFFDDLVKAVNVHFISMIEETAKYIKALNLENNLIGLLATAGTCHTQIYDKVFEKYDLKVKIPDAEHQTYITNAIYNLKQGLNKNDAPDVQKVLALFQQEGISQFILGCTELPIYFARHSFGVNTIDPTTILAKSAIKFAAGTQN